MASRSFVAPESWLAGATIYQVFPRAFSPAGTIGEVTAQLDRIRALGADVLYLTPIQPIGRERRIGTLGSPYAISDYRAIDPDQGTEQDFDELVARAHALGLRVVLDIVFHHVSPDAELVRSLPGSVLRDTEGRPSSAVPEWGDVADLVFTEEVRRRLVDVLLLWAGRGIDGFRCDVASLVPLDFWRRARAEVDDAHPGTLWIAESVDPGLVSFCRQHGIEVHEDAELFDAFDVEYPYDTWQLWRNAIEGTVPAQHYLDLLQWQSLTRPPHAMKLRCVENHDNARLRSLLPEDRALAWTALTALLPGPFLLYAGQEVSAQSRPSLFERELVDWSGEDITPWLSRLTAAKKLCGLLRRFDVLEPEGRIALSWSSAGGESDRTLLGLFDVDGSGGPVPVRLEDGVYRELLSDSDVVVAGGTIRELPPAAILDLPRTITWEQRHNPLLVGEAP